MNIVTATQLPAPLTPAKKTVKTASRCALCGRALKRGGADVPGLGITGPECAGHAAGLQLYLLRHNLGALIEHGEIVVEFERTPDGLWKLGADVLDTSARLKRAGLPYTAAHELRGGVMVMAYRLKSGALLHKLALRVGRDVA